jgi:hypothetical protein
MCLCLSSCSESCLLPPNYVVPTDLTIPNVSSSSSSSSSSNCSSISAKVRDFNESPFCKAPYTYSKVLSCPIPGQSMVCRLGDFVLSREFSESDVKEQRAVIYRLDGFVYQYGEQEKSSLLDMVMIDRLKTIQCKYVTLHAYVTEFAMMKSHPLKKLLASKDNNLAEKMRQISRMHNGNQMVIELTHSLDHTCSSHVSKSIPIKTIKSIVQVIQGPTASHAVPTHFSYYCCQYSVDCQGKIASYEHRNPLLCHKALSNMKPHERFAWIEIYIDSFGPVNASRAKGSWTAVYMSLSNIQQAHKKLRQHIKTVMIIPPDVDLTEALKPLCEDIKMLESEAGCNFHGLSIHGEVSFLISDHVRTHSASYK